MQIKYYPDPSAVETAMKHDEPLLVLVSMAETEVLVSNIDDVMEHAIMLKKMNYKETCIDEYFRIVLNRGGADWTFACPSDYCGIKDRNRRIEAFYNDGIDAISKAIRLLGYEVNINIPDRYRRHFNTLSE